MKNAHINSKAAAGGTVRAASLVRRVLACALIGGAAMSVAHAGQGRGQQQQQQPEYRQEYNRDAEQRGRQYDERQQRQFDERASQARAQEQQRRQMEQQQSNDGRRNSRMTPDERRDLRRQINEAGAELYPNQRRRR